ncbi:SHOCT domain-containing protein [Arthrobacter sp. B1I2]|uniref:SHOCT domain-containing protein n=1 Tax=Arthrobacter sp. B1I2 TaxID=3042263 RepID=UPI002782EBC4|nr:SHOCT domain-containing protein [Arthrobacter sp. B1I2]MDQ0732430.1 putative membrane protein [Arthrobacter sp. B1I2]
MNEHAVPGPADGYLFEFKGKHPLRETARWVSGVGLVCAGVSIAIIGNVFHSYLSMPLGIAVAVLGAIMLVLYSMTKSRTKDVAAAPGRAGKRHVKNGSTGRDSVAADLALLADLYSRGALSAEEFSAAKRRILDS